MVFAAFRGIYRSVCAKSVLQFRSIRNMGTTCVGQKLYLIYFAQEHVEFRFPELRSLCRMLSIPLDESQLQNPDNPFLLLDLPSDDDAIKLVQRSVLMRSCYECWAHGPSLEVLLNHVKAFDQSVLRPYSTTGSSFRLRVHAFARKLKWEDIKQRIEDLLAFPLTTTVDLINPTHSFHLLEYYGTTEAEFPQHVYFGRWLADSARSDAGRFRLNQRYFIGTTSMDPLLSLVMANQAAVEKGSLVYDPFVGTGSLLIAAAHFGAFVSGADIDKALLHGRGRSTRAKNTWRKKDESVLANFKQYELEKQYLDILVSDAARNIFRDDFQFDAIISDPPYGVREPLARVKTLPVNPNIKNPLVTSHMLLGRCELNHLIIILVNLAAKHLRIGGRLVYWLPAVQDEYDDSAVPNHECLELFSNSEQKLAGKACRRLITMVKVKDWRPEYQVTFAMDIYTTTFRERYFNASKTTRQKTDIKPESAQLQLESIIR